MKKDTSKLLEELQSCSDFKRFYNENADNFPKKKLCDYLGELLEKHSLKKSEIIKRSELNEIYAYQIFSGTRVPDRKKIINIAIAMELSLDEVQNLLKCSGYAPLYAKNEFDCIVIYGICQKLNVADINYLLYEHGEDTL
ncbi:MAG: hypothetical protein IJA55_09635 [Clostridia bacterium]|nr:hypothetical protein [Clostridia bacterium]MBQ4602350.1 hypothetical protein [Clostridia bacterium]